MNKRKGSRKDARGARHNRIVILGLLVLAAVLLLRRLRLQSLSNPQSPQVHDRTGEAITPSDRRALRDLIEHRAHP